jgi:hypothetical protein
MTLYNFILELIDRGKTEHADSLIEAVINKMTPASDITPRVNTGLAALNLTQIREQELKQQARAELLHEMHDAHLSKQD